MGRKFWLGVVYMVFGFAMCGIAVWRGDAALVASAAGACLSLATGLAATIWGNVQVHKAGNGSAAPG
jgi:hypothetical protein